ncbi:MAG TPA: 5'/3'-nucleotidase SurE [Deltaproteobacteria bacterium]|nr:5'/3'-nucleotidase SurE [Deltaproteobacteria bacterium]
MLILVSNDDGIYAEGIQVLAETLKKIARIVVVAPDREKSAASHSLTLHRPLRISNIKKNYYAVSGTPTDCISLGVNEILQRKRPDLIVSGINHGGNLGDDVHYSGTVSAAIEGAMMGIPAIAVSLVARDDRLHFKPAANFAAKLAKMVQHHGLPPGIVLNVNVPNLTERQMKGYVVAKLGKRNYSDIIVEKLDPRKKKYYWIGGDEVGYSNIPGSDCNAILEKKISITPLKVDMTDYPFLEKIREWKI